MALITRLTRLFRADAHAVLDRLEEPDVLLRQAVREMEEEAARNAQALKALELEHEHTRRHIGEIESSLSGIAGELDLCFAAQNHNLVRILLRRRLEGERLAQHLGQRLDRQSADLLQRRGALADQRQRLDGMRQKAAIFDVESNTSCADGSAWSTPDIAVSEDDIDLALLREHQRRKAS